MCQPPLSGELRLRSGRATRRLGGVKLSEGKGCQGHMALEGWKKSRGGYDNNVRSIWGEVGGPEDVPCNGGTYSARRRAALPAVRRNGRKSSGVNGLGVRSGLVGGPPLRPAWSWCRPSRAGGGGPHAAALAVHRPRPASIGPSPGARRHRACVRAASPVASLGGGDA